MDTVDINNSVEPQRAYGTEHIPATSITTPNLQLQHESSCHMCTQEANTVVMHTPKNRKSQSLAMKS